MSCVSWGLALSQAEFRWVVWCLTAMEWGATDFINPTELADGKTIQQVGTGVASSHHHNIRISGQCSSHRAALRQQSVMRRIERGDSSSSLTPSLPPLPGNKLQAIVEMTEGGVDYSFEATGNVQVRPSWHSCC